MAHRPTLKHKNKPFKHPGKTQPSKKTSGKSIAHPQANIDWSKLNKNDRQNTAQQKRKNQREELQRKRRGLVEVRSEDMALEGDQVFPKTIVLLGMNPQADLETLRLMLIGECEETPNGLKLPKWAVKKQFITVHCVERELHHVLDWAKVADVLVPVLAYTGGDVSAILHNPEVCNPFDELAYSHLSALRAQGMPKIVGLIQGLPERKGKDVEVLLTRYFHSEFPEDAKVITDKDPQQVLRLISLSAQAAEEMQWREVRSYLKVEASQVNDNGDLEVSGWIRGSGNLNANQLVHVTGYGDFQLAGIKSQAGEFVAETPESLVAENEPDPFGAEQTWPEEDDLAKAFESLQIVKTDHDAAVMPEDSSDDEGIEEVAGNVSIIEIEPRKPEDLDFPDEVDAPSDQPARVRFQKYRGLKSFKSSVWDPYENLPREYANLWEFKEHINSIRKWATSSVYEASQTRLGQFVTLTLKGFPLSILQSHPATLPLIISSLLPCERKLTVQHFKLQRWGNIDEPVASKEAVQLHIGFRRLKVQPLYSEDTTGQDKHKYLRLFNERTAVASIYFPAMFGPSNALVFKDTMKGQELVAIGSLMPFDPKRLIIKRIVLTGNIVKVHRRKAVVRYMFFNPDDVRYFKPIELFTKRGMRGHIKETLGTHGHMKCVFNDFMTHNDTVALPLYKRVFPVWAPTTWQSVS